jgi:uncharacterized protein
MTSLATFEGAEPRPLPVISAGAARAQSAFLREGAIAVVGVSRTGKKFGNAAYRTLREKGYRVYPIHPSAGAINGVRCYRSFADLPERVKALLIVVPPQKVVGILEDAAAAGIRHVWLQQGSESREAVDAARRLGLDVVAGGCVLMYAEPTGIHKVHGWLHRMFQRTA